MINVCAKLRIASRRNQVSQESRTCQIFSVGKEVKVDAKGNPSQR